jgi:hypothetical protein
MFNQIPTELILEIIEPLLIYERPINMSGVPAPLVEFRNSRRHEGVITLNRTSLSLFSITKRIRDIALEIFWSKNSFYINATHVTRCEVRHSWSLLFLVLFHTCSL